MMKWGSESEKNKKLPEWISQQLRATKAQPHRGTQKQYWIHSSGALLLKVYGTWEYYVSVLSNSTWVVIVNSLIFLPSHVHQQAWL